MWTNYNTWKEQPNKSKFEEFSSKVINQKLFLTNNDGKKLHNERVNDVYEDIMKKIAVWNLIKQKTTN